MSEPVVSVPTSVVNVGLNLDPDTAHYVGILEGTIAALVINETKYRALLELLTGDSWEATRIDIDGNVMMGIAVDALVKQTGMDLVKAKVLVAQRWSKRNLPTETVVPQAISIDELVDQNRPLVDNSSNRQMSSRFQEWKAKQLQATTEDETPSATTGSEGSLGAKVVIA